MNIERNTPDLPRFRIASTPGGDLVFYDGERKIEMGRSRREYKDENRVEYTLFAKTIQHWEYPHEHEPITDELREHILTETTRLLKARDSRIQVIVNRTKLGGDQW
jgi:hypothetical protein